MAAHVGHLGAPAWEAPLPDTCDALRDVLCTEGGPCCAYSALVLKLPPDTPGRERLACPCCPGWPGLSFCLWLNAGLIPHLMPLVGYPIVTCKVLELRRILAPPGVRVEGFCETWCPPCCEYPLRYKVQMKRALEVRKALGRPVVPVGGAHGTLVVPPPSVTASK